jgi:hypothetical protein
LPFQYNVAGAVAAVNPTAHPLDPPDRYTPFKVVGLPDGVTEMGLVQLKLPPSHLSIVGLPDGSATPTAHPSESLSMKTDLSSIEFGDVVVLQIALA